MDDGARGYGRRHTRQCESLLDHRNLQGQRGETDISDASRPILKSEMDACKQVGITYYELPVAFDAITVVVNPKSFLKNITVEPTSPRFE